MFGSTDVIKTPLATGGFILSSATPLGNYADRITDRLVHWAHTDPNRPFLAQRGTDKAWETITYGAMLQKVRAIGQFLINAGCSTSRPVASISDNSIETACFALGAMYAGVPFAPISPAYARIPSAHTKLHSCLSLLKPELVYLEKPDDIANVIEKVLSAKAKIIGPKDSHLGPGLATITNTPADNIDIINQKLGPDTIAKYLFTSGSTGTPKAVINTHRMLCSNQKQFELTYPFVGKEPPILVDWLPWSHTFGGNEIFFLVMTQGGTLYIDRGKPVGASLAETIANLKSVSPTIYFNVPAGFEQLLTHMEHDVSLKQAFFARLKMAFYAGAGMPQRVWTQLETLSMQTTGHRVAVVTAWGATETAPLASAVNFVSHRSDNIGLPVPGCEIRFAPIGERYELRVRGPNVMPGYLGQTQQTQAAFDEEGFYKTGDSAELACPSDPEKGIIFGGRLSEDFKLQTGTWVSVGRLAGLLIAELMPLVSDVVIAGPDRKYLTALLFLNLEAARTLTSQAEATLQDLAGHPAIRAHIRDALEKHNKTYDRTTMLIKKFLVLPDQPDPERHEITEKGSINQTAVLKNRKTLIDELYICRQTYQTACPVVPDRSKPSTAR